MSKSIANDVILGIYRVISDIYTAYMTVLDIVAICCFISGIPVESDPLYVVIDKSISIITIKTFVITNYRS